MIRINKKFQRDTRITMEPVELDPECPQDMITLSMYNEALSRGDIEGAVAVVQVAENVTLRNSKRHEDMLKKQQDLAALMKQGGVTNQENGREISELMKLTKTLAEAIKGLDLNPKEDNKSK